MARRIACRCRSRPSSPSHAMSAAYSRSWLRSKQPPPSARHARPRGPKPSEPHGSGLQERICSSSCLSWLPPSQELEPPAIPGRFTLLIDGCNSLFKINPGFYCPQNLVTGSKDAFEEFELFRQQLINTLVCLVFSIEKIHHDHVVLLS